jgi:hypothetical protein
VKRNIPNIKMMQRDRRAKVMKRESREKQGDNWETKKGSIFWNIFFILFYFHISHLGTYYGNGKHHIQYTSSDTLHMV